MRAVGVHGLQPREPFDNLTKPLIEQSTERRSFHFGAWSFLVELHQNCLRCLTCFGFGPIQSLFPKDHAPSYSLGIHSVTPIAHGSMRPALR